MDPPTGEDRVYSEVGGEFILPEAVAEAKLERGKSINIKRIKLILSQTKVASVEVIF